MTADDVIGATCVSFVAIGLGYALGIAVLAMWELWRDR